MNKHLVKFLIEQNKELVEKTAIRNCHCFGLHSFIINEKPKMRLFVASSDCELYYAFDKINPIIPIHPHKYDDLFFQIEGVLTHHIYVNSEISFSYGIRFNKYTYSRISDGEVKPKLIGQESLVYLSLIKNPELLFSNQLHSISLSGEKCSWVVIETYPDPNFQQFAYHQNLVKREGLYQPFTNAYEFLKKRFDIL